MAGRRGGRGEAGGGGRPALTPDARSPTPEKRTLSPNFNTDNDDREFRGGNGRGKFPRRGKSLIIQLAAGLGVCYNHRGKIPYEASGGGGRRRPWRPSCPNENSSSGVSLFGGLAALRGRSSPAGRGRDHQRLRGSECTGRGSGCSPYSCFSSCPARCRHRRPMSSPAVSSALMVHR